MLSKKTKIFLAGHKGMVCSSILKKLKKSGYKNILLADKKKLNLLNQSKVYKYLKKNKPKLVIIAAAKVGGILANSKYKDKLVGIIIMMKIPKYKVIVMVIIKILILLKNVQNL